MNKPAFQFLSSPNPATPARVLMDKGRNVGDRPSLLGQLPPVLRPSNCLQDMRAVPMEMTSTIKRDGRTGGRMSRRAKTWRQQLKYCFVVIELKWKRQQQQKVQFRMVVSFGSYDLPNTRSPGSFSLKQLLKAVSTTEPG